MPAMGLVLLAVLVLAHRCNGLAVGSAPRLQVMGEPPVLVLARLSAESGTGSYVGASRTTRCRRQLLEFAVAVDERRLWALKMLDSSGEPLPGFLYGNNYWLGSRSECGDASNRSPLDLNADVLRNESRFRPPLEQQFPPYPINFFVAHIAHNSSLQYHLRLPNENVITLGLCLPASCTTHQLAPLLDQMFRNKNLSVGNLYSADFQLIQVKDLREDEQREPEMHVLIIKSVIVLIMALMLIGTVYDVLVEQHRSKLEEMNNLGQAYTDSNENNDASSLISASGGVEGNAKSTSNKTGEECTTLKKIILCFSVYSNTKLIFTTKLSKESITPIHGLKFFGMIWIIMIHTAFYMSDVADNKAWSWRLSEGLAMQFVSNSTFSVDTFFFLSGFLLTYMYLGAHSNDCRKEPKCKLRLLEFAVTMLRRYIRLTPPYLMVLGLIQINTLWYEKTTEFYMTERPQEVCGRYWWRNVLYINNLFGRKNMCMSWSWYLSNDMQFFIIGDLLMILSSVFFHLAAGILLFLLLASISITTYISYTNEYVPTLDQQLQMLDVLYDPPWTRIGPHIVGMIAAYILVRQNKKLSLRSGTIVVFWLIGISCILSTLFGLYRKQLPLMVAALYVGLSRTVWAIGIAWIVMACCTGHGGIVDKILSYRTWIPLSRLTYCAYLLHPFIINSIYVTSETAIHVQFWSNTVMFLGFCVITYVCSFVLSLMLETPTVLLMRKFMSIKKT